MAKFCFQLKMQPDPPWTVVVSISRHIRADPRGTLPHRWPCGSKEALKFMLSPFKHIRMAASWSCPGDTFPTAVVQVSLTDTDLFATEPTKQCSQELTELKQQSWSLRGSVFWISQT